MPEALADLRPGAVVQAAAINALAELGYSPERAVERATQIVAGNGDKPGLNDDDDRGAIVADLQEIVDRLAAPRTEVDGEVVRTALAPGASGAFANALRQPARPRAFNASAVPIPVPGPLGALIAVLTLMMILIEEQRRRNRPLPAEPPPDEPANEDQEQERLQDPPAPPPVPPQRRPPQRSPELPPLSGEEGRRAEPPTPFTEPERDGSRLHAEVRRILRRFPEARRDLIRREFINTERLNDINSYTINIDVGGGIEAANRDFEDLVRRLGGDPALATTQRRPGGAGDVRTLTVPDGVTINVRPTSSSGRPTVELQHGDYSIARRY